MVSQNGHTPVLDGWKTAEQAAQLLGVSRQTSARIFQHRRLRTIHAVGDRPLYVAREEEVLRLRELYEKAATEPHTHAPGTPRERTHAHEGPDAWAVALQRLSEERPKASFRRWVAEPVEV